MKYFDFDELTRSQLALANGFRNEPFVFDELDVYNNLETLVDKLLDPIRERFAMPMIVTSGYRCKSLNDMVGGVAESQHRKGQAVDFVFKGFSTREMLAAFFEISDDFDFDQLIFYRRRGFIHISYVEGKNRHEAFVKNE